MQYSPKHFFKAVSTFLAPKAQELAFHFSANYCLQALLLRVDSKGFSAYLTVLKPHFAALLEKNRAGNPNNPEITHK